MTVFGASCSSEPLLAFPWAPKFLQTPSLVFSAANAFVHEAFDPIHYLQSSTSSAQLEAASLSRETPYFDLHDRRDQTSRAQTNDGCETN